MASKEKSLDIDCESCKKTFTQATLLKHIGQRSACKVYYGSRFTQMKKEKAREKNDRQRAKMSRKEEKYYLKRNRLSYAKNEKQKEKNRKTYQEKKEQIKAKNEKESRDFLLFKKKENEKEIAELSDKGKDLNILFKSTMNLKDVLKESPVLCENCKDAYETNAILKHIGNNKECKAFYGPSFEKFKLEKERLRIKNFKLAKQRKNYASDPKIQENKKEFNKKSYQTAKDKKSAIKEKKRIEYQKEDAKHTFQYKKKVAKETNSLWRKKLQWVIDCFEHFLDMYPQTNQQVKNEMRDLKKEIEDKFVKMEEELEEIIKKVENSEDHFEICSAFKGQKQSNGIYKGGKDGEEIKHEWQTFEQFQVGKKLENILENINETERKKEWYYRVQLIQGEFKEKYQPWWGDSKQEYTTSKTCIICSKKPNCLEKNWLTRVEFEKVKYSVMVYVARGIKEPSKS